MWNKVEYSANYHTSTAKAVDSLEQERSLADWGKDMVTTILLLDVAKHGNDTIPSVSGVIVKEMDLILEKICKAWPLAALKWNLLGWRRYFCDILRYGGARLSHLEN